MNALKESTITVRCTGNDETHGHPAVYLQIPKDQAVGCPYCGQVFQQKAAENVID